METVKKQKWRKKMITLFFLFLLLFNFSQPVLLYSVTETSIDTKITIETNMENRLRKVLTEIAGTEKIIVIVNTELYSEKEKQELKLKSEQEKPKIVLPGVPVKENIAERKLEDLLAPLDIGKTKTLIKKISATVIVDKTVPKSIVEILKKVTIGLLGIDFERGDQLVFEQISFQKTQFTWTSLIYPPNLFSVIGLVLGMFFVFGILMFFYTHFRGLTQNFLTTLNSYIAWQKENQGISGISALPEAETLTETRQTEHYLPETEEERTPFWFITDSQINRLKKFFQTEIPENIAVVLNYLDERITNQLFSVLSPEKQKKVIAFFSSGQQFSPERVKELEQKIKDNLRYSIDAEEKLLSIIDHNTRDNQEKIISEIKQNNTQLAEQIRSLTVSIEDLANLDSTTVQTIIRQSNIAVLAQIFKTLKQEIQNKVLDKLPEVLRRRIQQEMEMGRPLSNEQLENERIKIIRAIRQFKLRG